MSDDNYENRHTKVFAKIIDAKKTNEEQLNEIADYIVKLERFKLALLSDEAVDAIGKYHYGNNWELEGVRKNEKHICRRNTKARG